MPKLCVIEGDGIGHEVIPVAVEVLQQVVPDLECVTAEAGWDCFVRTGDSVPDATLEALRQCGAGLFGAVSSPSEKVEGYQSAILKMRQALGMYANIRPVQSWPEVSPRDGVDLIVVRENSEGLYARRESIQGETAIAEKVVTRSASRRIAQKTCQLVNTLQRNKITIVHKANVLPISDGLFRDSICQVIEQEVPDIEWNEKLVDLAALQIATEPQHYDVIVTTNLYGDILSDVAALWGGGLGMVPSLNWGEQVALAEPVHGSAPDIAGKGIANPLAAVLSAEMLVRYVWELPTQANQIKAAVAATLRQWNQWDPTKLTSQIRDALLDHLLVEQES